MRIRLFNIVPYFCLALIFNIPGLFLDSWNSDLVTPELVFKNLTSGSGIRGWFLSDTLLIFPDWPLWFITRLFIKPVNLALYLYQIILTSLVFYWCSLHFEKRKFISIIMLASLWIILFKFEWRAFNLPVHHGGALLCGLWWAYYYQRYQFNIKKVITLSLVGALIAASDLLFGVWFLIPLGGTTIISYLHKKIIIQDVLKSMLIGFLIIIFIPGIYFILRDILGINWHSGVESFPLFSRTLLGSKLMLAYFIESKWRLGLFIFSIFLIVKRYKENYLLLMSSIVVTSFILCISGIWIDKYSVRYMYPFSFFILIPLVDFINDIVKINLRKFLEISIVILALYKIFILVWNNPFHKLDYYPKGISCVDGFLETNNLVDKHGIGTYWSNKMFLTFSKHDLLIEQVNLDLETPHLWLINSQRKIDLKMVEYAIFSKREEGQIKGGERYRQKIDCGDYKLLIR